MKITVQAGFAALGAGRELLLPVTGSLSAQHPQLPQEEQSLGAPFSFHMHTCGAGWVRSHVSWASAWFFGFQMHPQVIVSKEK